MPADLIVKNYRAVNKGAFKGSCTVELPLFRINDVRIMDGANGLWAALPSRPMIGADGQPMKDDKGKARYLNIVEFTKKETGDRFSRDVIAALKSQGVEL